MEGYPGGFRTDSPDPEQETGPDFVPASNPRWLLFPILTFAGFFGLLAAVAAILSSGVLSPEAAGAPSESGNWRISAVLIAAIASAWFAGAACLAIMLFRPASRKRHLQGEIAAWLAAFAAGPLLVVIFAAAVTLAQGHQARLIAYVIAAALLLVLILGQRRDRLLAERMLVSFFLWIAILVVPTFWRDAVNLQMSELLFGLLGAAGLRG